MRPIAPSTLRGTRLQLEQAARRLKRIESRHAAHATYHVTAHPQTAGDFIIARALVDAARSRLVDVDGVLAT